MKNKLGTWFLRIAIIGVLLVFLANCKKAEEKATTTCVDAVSLCGTSHYKVCGPSDPLKTTGFYIEYNGTKYPYDSSNGSAVMVQVQKIMCPNLSPEETIIGVNQMMDQVRLLSEEITLENNR